MKAKSIWHILPFLGMFGGLMGSYRKSFVDRMRIRSAIYYLKAMQSVRGICIAFIQVLGCAIFFVMGLLLLHVALFLCLTSNMSQTAWLFFVLGTLELGIALICILWFLSSKRWLDAAAKSNPVIAKIASPDRT